MEGISDIKIIGIDERRPPLIRKEPYIDLNFKLSHQAPADWCNTFNSLLSKHPSAPRIKENEGLYIETWVRSADEIVSFFELLKQTVTDCSRQYIEKIEAATQLLNDNNALLVNESGEQGNLNRIIAGLNYENTDTD